MKSTLRSVYFLPTKYYGGEINIHIEEMCSNTKTLRISHWPSVTRPMCISPKLNNLNFYPLEVVSRCRDLQCQVSENHPYLFNLKLHICKS